MTHIFTNSPEVYIFRNQTNLGYSKDKRSSVDCDPQQREKMCHHEETVDLKDQCYSCRDSEDCSDYTSSAAHRLPETSPPPNTISCVLPPPKKFSKCRKGEADGASTSSYSLNREALAVHRASVGRMIATSESADWGRS